MPFAYQLYNKASYYETRLAGVLLGSAALTGWGWLLRPSPLQQQPQGIFREEGAWAQTGSFHCQVCDSGLVPSLTPPPHRRSGCPQAPVAPGNPDPRLLAPALLHPEPRILHRP